MRHELRMGIVIPTKHAGPMRLLVIGALLLAVFATTARAEQQPPLLTFAEQGVLEVLFAQAPATSKTDTHYLQEKTIDFAGAGRTYEEFARQLRQTTSARGAEFKEALEDFLEKNKTPVSIVLPRTSKELRVLKEPPGTSRRSTTSPPTGVSTISRVGIDSKRTVAIVYLGHRWPHRGGLTRFYVLRREGDDWVFNNETFGPGVAYME